MRGGESLLPKHGGYKNTRTWQLADLIYDVTVRFCDKYVNPRSRTHDQMVQAARSGCQNLQEGSVDSATSKKIELKLTGIAKGSLKELERDYQKFLQHRGLPEWQPDHPALMRFKALRWLRCKSFASGSPKKRNNIQQDRETERRTRTCRDRHGRRGQKSILRSVQVHVHPCLPGISRRCASPTARFRCSTCAPI